MSPPLPTPAERLVLSRERLRLALREVSAPGASSQKTSSVPSVWSWLNNLNTRPGANAPVEAVRQWWSVHPWRVVGELAFEAARAALRPLAQRHPFGLVLGAFALGAVLTWTRPWRPLLTPTLWVRLLPKIWSAASAGMTTQSWLIVLTGLLRFVQSRHPVAGTVKPD